MKSVANRIEEIKSNGYQLNFDAVINSAFENYKKIALYAGLMLFVFMVFFGLIASTALISFVGIDNLNPENIKQYSPENLTGIPLLIYMAINIFVSVLIAPFLSGFYKMADCAKKDIEFHVSTMFEYYKSPYLMEICLATFVLLLFNSGLSMLFETNGYAIIGAIIGALISFFSFLTVPLIVFGKLGAIAAIKSSFIIIYKKPLTLLALVIIAIIGALVGFIGCCIGIFFTIPFLYSMYYTVYNEIIGYESDSELVL
ncbi:hypothetical protein [Flavobacterium granuli]|uniref:Uncharacterized protein n=1 Tax=Flavobacterium granuli TaxID=280093 RepID=A0A1M5RCK0_9FLAO|nr:hypothetical protein [Flavobacterium granuli]PRZ21696.1 hypothetical protein BC624_108137 [Flavobacterium granuli]SHH24045.1 hypothetical protein SAMN05443373_109136 [Flavobacterium granuli]